jgi:two-component system, NtrC family, response regulator HupR/HoxA
MDFERHQNLRAIIMLKEIIRKWWGTEVFFVDESGNWISPPRDQEGSIRWLEPIRVLQDTFKSTPTLRSWISPTGAAAVAAAAVYAQGKYQGLILVGGVRGEPGFETDRLKDLLELGAKEIANAELAESKPVSAVQSLATEQAEWSHFNGMVGQSASMIRVFQLLQKICSSESTVLINGESGTGKELVAQAIHEHGPRRDKPFVVQNCSAFNDNLLESALFGHIRGAFTDALRDSKGLFEVADGGTFFLDEVCDMSAALQVKLLRVLESGAFLPVGGTQLRRVDVRVIAATHKDLATLVRQGTFREDLFYRINVIAVRVPPLRERMDDLPALIDHFAHKHHPDGQRSRVLSDQALQVLSAYSWPGNIRELENEIERLLILGSDLETIPAELISARIRDSASRRITSLAAERTLGTLNQLVEKLERETIRQGLLRTGNNKSQLARELGISRSNLILKIAKYGLNQLGAREDQDTGL